MSGYCFEQLNYFGGDPAISTATVKVRRGEEFKADTGVGKSTSEAIFNAIDRALGEETVTWKVRRFTVQVIGGVIGREGRFQISVFLTSRQHSDQFSFTVNNSDFGVALAQAYLEAINKLLSVPCEQTPKVLQGDAV